MKFKKTHSSVLGSLCMSLVFVSHANAVVTPHTFVSLTADKISHLADGADIETVEVTVNTSDIASLNWVGVIANYSKGQANFRGNFHWRAESGFFEHGGSYWGNQYVVLLTSGPNASDMVFDVQTGNAIFRFRYVATRNYGDMNDVDFTVNFGDRFQKKYNGNIHVDTDIGVISLPPIVYPSHTLSSISRSIDVVGTSSVQEIILSVSSTDANDLNWAGIILNYEKGLGEYRGNFHWRSDSGFFEHGGVYWGNQHVRLLTSGQDASYREVVNGGQTVVFHFKFSIESSFLDSEVSIFTNFGNYIRRSYDGTKNSGKNFWVSRQNSVLQYDISDIVFSKVYTDRATTLVPFGSYRIPLLSLKLEIFDNSISHRQVSAITFQRNNLSPNPTPLVVWMEQDGKKISGKTTVSGNGLFTVSFDKHILVSEFLPGNISLIGSSVGYSSAVSQVDEFIIRSADDIAIDFGKAVAFFPILSHYVTYSNMAMPTVEFDTTSAVSDLSIGVYESLATFDLNVTNPTTNTLTIRRLKVRYNSPSNIYWNLQNINIFRNGVNISNGNVDKLFDGSEYYFEFHTSSTGAIVSPGQNMFEIRASVASTLVGGSFSLILERFDDVLLVSQPTEGIALSIKNNLPQSDLILGERTLIFDSIVLIGSGNDKVTFYRGGISSIVEVGKIVTPEDLLADKIRVYVDLKNFVGDKKTAIESYISEVKFDNFRYNLSANPQTLSEETVGPDTFYFYEFTHPLEFSNDNYIRVVAKMNQAMPADDVDINFSVEPTPFTNLRYEISGEVIPASSVGGRKDFVLEVRDRLFTLTRLDDNIVTKVVTTTEEVKIGSFVLRAGKYGAVTIKNIKLQLSGNNFSEQSTTDSLSPLKLRVAGQQVGSNLVLPSGVNSANVNFPDLNFSISQSSQIVFDIYARVIPIPIQNQSKLAVFVYLDNSSVSDSSGTPILGYISVNLPLVRFFE